MTQNLSSLFTQIVQAGGGPGQTTADQIQIGWQSNAVAPKMAVNGTDLGQIWCDWNAVTTVNSSNGINNAIYKLPNGLYMQVQSFQCPSADNSITYPTAFPTTTISLHVTPVCDGSNALLGFVNNITRTGFSLHSRVMSGGSLNGVSGIGYYYLALGY